MKNNQERLLRIYHFSVKFDGSEMLFHGEYITMSKDFVIIAKSELTKKLKVWKKQAKDVVSFEVYDNDRNVLFSWSK